MLALAFKTLKTDNYGINGFLGDSYLERSWGEIKRKTRSPSSETLERNPESSQGGEPHFPNGGIITGCRRPYFLSPTLRHVVLLNPHNSPFYREN